MGKFNDWWKNMDGGRMKQGFVFPDFSNPIGNANLGYSLNGGIYDNVNKRFLNADDLAYLRSQPGGEEFLKEALADGRAMKTGAGLNVGGYQLGKLYTLGDAAVNVGMGISNLDKLGKTNKETSDLKTNIISTAASTPNVYNYLTTDEQKMLNQLKRGNYTENSWGSDIGDWGDVLGGGVKGALAGLPGGIPGMIVGGLGGAINSGLSSANKKKQTSNSRLDALYNSLNYARNDYNSMKRPNFSGLGLQQRYRDAYM